MAFAGPAAVQGDEAERRRQQNTMMDEYLRTAGVGPERQMRIDPATAGASLDRILQNPAIEAPPAVPPHIPAGPRDGPAAIGAAPQFAAEAGSLPPVYTLEHPAFGAGINIRDSPDVEVAKMQMNRQAQLGVLNAMIAADRNQVAGRDVAARLFGAQSQAWADREKLLQGERQRTATGQQFYDKLAADKALAEMTAANNLKLAMVPYGPEANKAATRASIMTHPENAKAILDTITKYDNGTLTAAPVPVPVALASPPDTRLPMRALLEQSAENAAMPIAAHPPSPNPPQPPWLQRNVVSPIGRIVPNMPF